MGEAERGESEGFQRWAGFLSRRQTREGGGQRASTVPAVPICGPDSCSHFGEGEGRGGGLIESGKVPADTSAGCACVRCSLGGGGPLPASPQGLSLGSSGPAGERRLGGCLRPSLGSTLPDPEGQRALAPAGSHVLPGSPQVLSRVGAGWPAGAGGLVMNHVVPPAAHSPGWGQGADSPADPGFSSPAWPTEAAAAPSFPAASVGHTHRESGVCHLAPALVEGEASLPGRRRGLWWTGSTCHPRPSGWL